jgi:hypothetical protein
MDRLQFAPLLRAAELAAALISICLAIVWSIGRLGRAAWGDVWWLRRVPKLAYTIIFPAFLLVQYGPHGLVVYLIVGAFLSAALLFAALLATK